MNFGQSTKNFQTSSGNLGILFNIVVYRINRILHVRLSIRILSFESRVSTRALDSTQKQHERVDKLIFEVRNLGNVPYKKTKWKGQLINKLSNDSLTALQV